MGALGEELMDTDTASSVGPLLTDALHSVSTVLSLRPKRTFVSDSFLGKGPEKWAGKEMRTLCNVYEYTNTDASYNTQHAQLQMHTQFGHEYTRA